MVYKFSQQLAMIPFPFMRKSIALAAITVLAGNNDIAARVRAAAIKRDHVIDMVGLPDFLAAPVTFALLSIILTLYLRIGNDACALFLGAIAMCFGPYLCRISPRPFTIIRPTFFRMALHIFTFVLSFLFWMAL